MSSDTAAVDGALHRVLLAHALEHGRAPSLEEAAGALELDLTATEQALRRLEADHGVVLHPGQLEPWLVHPVSLTPTAFWVTTRRYRAWAPCIWCACGILALDGGDGTIHTRLGGEEEPVVVEARGDTLEPSGLVAHFPMPLMRAWDNVHAFCAATLVFRSRTDVDGWCERHGYARGDVLPLAQVRELGRVWYGKHLAPDWRKWSVDEARAIFTDLGLRGPIWELPRGSGRF